MDQVELKLNNIGHGAFVLEKEGERLAEMEIGIKGDNLTVYHTEVAEFLQGQGIALRLFSALVAYARKNKLKVTPLCPYVRSQFSRYPEAYADIWNKTHDTTH